MRKLLFVSGTAANVREGSGTWVGIAALRTALERNGWQVDLIAPAQAGGFWARWRFNRNLKKSHRSQSYAAVVGFDLDGAGLARPGTLDVCSIKGVLAEEALWEESWSRWSLTLQARLERRRARAAGVVVATSRYAAHAIEKHYGVGRGHIRIVPELIDLAAWRGRWAALPPEPHAGIRVLCVAHLYPRKDVARLLLAMTRLPPSVSLHVAGDGPQRRRLQSLAARLGLGARARFLGHLPLAQLAAEYRNADIFCLPSRQEGFGIVLLEAMAAGLPILAARATAIPEIVNEGETAWLFEPGDAAALAVQLQALAADPEARQRLGAAGVRRVERFSAERVAGEFIEALGLTGLGRPWS